MLSLLRIFQLGILVFVSVSVLFTTKCLLQYLLFSLSSLPVLFRTSNFSSWQYRSVKTNIQTTHWKIFEHLDTHTFSLLVNGPYSSDDVAAPSVRLASPDFRQQLFGTSTLNASDFISQETFLSRAFSQSMHPTRILPYFYRATGKFDDDDVTITTLVTSNRFKVLKQLVYRYRGPISVTIHVPFPLGTTLAELPSESPTLNVLRDLHDLYHSTPTFATFVDVHLAFSPFSRKPRAEKLKTGTASDGEGEGGRQFNVWRNVARLFSRTEFVMMLDVDFAVCTDWRGVVRHAIEEVRDRDIRLANNSDSESGPTSGSGESDISMVKMLREGSAALVVPVFEYVNPEDGEDQWTFPQDKQTLLRLINASPPIISSFHATWAPGHNSTDYAKYYSIPPGDNEMYKVKSYQSAYEPYVITSKRVPWCDERFTGYGANKAACLFEMYLSGVSFYVLSDHFLIHQSHKYEEQARREERKYNRKLYTDFKEEVCLRYLYRFHHDGSLDSARGSNVREECRKIKSVTKIAAELLGVTL